MKRLITLAAALLLALAVPVTALAANFTPSVEAKPAPELVRPNLGPDYPNAVAAIYDSNGNILAALEEGDIVITPLAEADSAPLEEIAEMLKNAHQEILSAGDLAELCAALDARAAAIDPSCTAEDFVVRDLFDVTLTGTAKEMLKNGAYLELIFDIDLEAEELPPVVIYKCPGDQWSALEQQQVLNNGNGTVTVRFNKLCPVAFLTLSDNIIVQDPDKTSPETGYAGLGGGAAAVGVCVAAAAGVILFLRKKKV